jgi:hypothetical protein
MDLYSLVRQAAEADGYQLDQLSDPDLYWLTTGTNWIGAQPGRTLTQIMHQLADEAEQRAAADEAEQREHDASGLLDAGEQ